MILYHTTDDADLKQNFRPESGRFGNFLFFARSRYARGENTYTLDATGMEFIDQSSIGYQKPYSDYQPIVLEFAEKHGVDEDMALEIIDGSQDPYELEDLQNDTYEVAWDAQLYAGRCAVALGYDGIIGLDEQGGFYMVNMSERIHTLKAA